MSEGYWFGQKDKNGIKCIDPYAFGYKVCAFCDGFTPHPLSRKLKAPVFADRQRTEVLIPAGRQHFHYDCYHNLVMEAEATP